MCCPIEQEEVLEPTDKANGEVAIIHYLFEIFCCFLIPSVVPGVTPDVNR